MTDSTGAGFLGETLFHFLGSGNDDSLMDVFDSVIRRGLLLTVGNRDGKPDVFEIHVVGGSVEQLEVVQDARVCFTDIPEHLLTGHSQEYGKFGLGFSRKTIIEWGGNPVTYVPNHPDSDTLEASMGVLLYSLHRVPILMAALRACLAPGNASLTINGTTLIANARDEYINLADNSVKRALSFVKEMSSQNTNDYRYLYEREWRIVDGAIMPNGQNPTRGLNNDEYQELGAKRAHWTRPLEMSATLLNAHPHNSMLNLFRFFDGLQGKKTASQAIEVILVPNATLETKVAAYIAERRDAFRPGGPEVRIFGSPRSCCGLYSARRWLRACVQRISSRMT